MKKYGLYSARVVMILVMVALFGFTVTRSTHLLQGLLPPSEWYIAYLGLAAFDGGLIAWGLFLMFGARGSGQRAICFTMIVICLLGITLMLVGDFWFISSAAGQLPQLSERKRILLIMTIALIISAHIIAKTWSLFLSPDAVKRWKLQDAEDKVMEEGFSALDRAAPHAARESGAPLAYSMLNDLYASMSLAAPRNLHQLPQYTQTQVQTEPLSNPGHSGNQVETGQLVPQPSQALPQITSPVSRPPVKSLPQDTMPMVRMMRQARRQAYLEAAKRGNTQTLIYDTAPGENTMTAIPVTPMGSPVEEEVSQPTKKGVRGRR